MRYDFLAIGDVTIDAFIRLTDAEERCNHGTRQLCVRFGEKVPYDEVTVVNGVGNAGNAAVCARRLGLTSALLTRIGNDSWGKDCLSVYEKEGVATEYVGIDRELPTNYHFVLRYGPERTILVHQQPYQYALPKFDAPPQWVYLTSLGEHAKEFHHEVAAYIRATGAKLAYQPGTFQIKMGADSVRDVYEASEVFFCNKEEAQSILKKPAADMPELLEGIISLGVKIAVITDGPHGAWMKTGHGTWRMPMYPDPKPPVSRTGAGDAFSTTFVAMLAEGLTPEEALVRAPINSMHVVQFVGAQQGLLTKRELDVYLNDAPPSYRIERVA